MLQMVASLVPRPLWCNETLESLCKHITQSCSVTRPGCRFIRGKLFCLCTVLFIKLLY